MSEPATDAPHAGVAGDADVEWAKGNAERGGSCPPRTTRALCARIERDRELLREALPELRDYQEAVREHMKGISRDAYGILDRLHALAARIQEAIDE